MSVFRIERFDSLNDGDFILDETGVNYGDLWNLFPFLRFRKEDFVGNGIDILLDKLYIYDSLTNYCTLDYCLKLDNEKLKPGFMCYSDRYPFLVLLEEPRCREDFKKLKFGYLDTDKEYLDDHVKFSVPKVVMVETTVSIFDIEIFKDMSNVYTKTLLNNTYDIYNLLEKYGINRVFI